MSVHKAQRNPYNDTIWRPQYVALFRNLLAPCHVICIAAGNWIQVDSLFDDPLHISVQSAAQFSQCLGSLLGSDTANPSAHSAVASTQGSSLL
jgi:hypothetical protein